MSPPRSPKRTINNNTVSGNFTKGSLIQLHNGELRRIEDMRTEDFVMSAERSPELRLAESTVVRIEEGQSGTATITLTYNQRRAQVEVESSASHPYFVMGAGWASCDPSATHLRYGLKVQRLQVGDVLISLTPRDPPATAMPLASTPASSMGMSLCGGNRTVAASTVMTTATATAVTARQLSSANSISPHHSPHSSNAAHVLKISTQANTHQQQQHHPSVSTQSQPINLHFSSHAPTIAPPMSPDSAAAAAARKRRWSAPDQICEEAELQIRRHRPSGATPE
ncbi:unnamed protein product [Callosobruchus maculatus]|uniref:AXH domain-containing protein n=1 Tax=Callosobruchus maculatus TaxID=64391 RepID=A0A653DT37_CALMS|nr:unnamed protein product [Callosobruchus maculatus]